MPEGKLLFEEIKLNLVAAVMILSLNKFPSLVILILFENKMVLSFILFFFLKNLTSFKSKILL